MSTSAPTFPTFDVLDDKNYSTWAERCEDALVYTDLWSYVSGSKVRPADGDAAATAAQEAWDRQDNIARAVIRMRVHTSQLPHIKGIQTSKGVWDKLKRQHRQQGMLTQVTLLTKAFSTRLERTLDPPMETVAHEICDHIQHIFDIGTPTCDQWQALFLLQSLSPQLAHIRRDLDNLLHNGALSKQAVYDRLACEHERLREETSTASAQAAIAQAYASTSIHANAATNSNGIKPCSNCVSQGKSGRNHPYEKCWGPGGPLEGQKPERLIQKEKERAAAKKKKKAEQANIVQGADSGEESCALAESSDSLSIENDPGIAMNTSTILTPISPSFYYDSAATSHISPNRDDFDTLTVIAPRPIKGISGSAIHATGIGSITLACGKTGKIVLRDVLHVPAASIRLVSIGRLCDDDDDLSVTFSAKSCSVLKHDTLLATGTRIGRGLYAANGRPTIVVPVAAKNTTPSISDSSDRANVALPITVWHNRLGHVNYKSIARMASRDMARGMTITTPSSPHIKCDHCILGKQTKTAIPKLREGERSKIPLDIVYGDLIGPEDVPTAGGKSYALNLIDDYSRMLWTILLRNKSDAVAAFRDWKLHVEKESGKSLRILRTDNGRELTANTFEDWLRSQGVVHQTSAPYTSAHMGSVERSHRTIRGRSRAMRSQADLPPNMWGECLLTATYLRNRTPTRALDDKTPYELWYGSRPDLSRLREFGCRAFVLIQSEHNPKIYNRSVECVLVGYSETSKAYKCYNRQTRRIHVSNNVVFIESHESPTSNPPPTIVDPSLLPTNKARPTAHIRSETPSEIELQIPLPATSFNPPIPTPTSSQMSTPTPSATAPTPSATSRPQRAKQPSQEERIRAEVKESAQRLASLRQSKIQQRASASDDIAYSLEELIFAIAPAFGADIPLDEDEPATWTEACNSPYADNWREGYEEELASIRKHEVYELVPRSSVPKGRKVIQNKPCFKLKRDQDNNPARFKVRLVAKGHTQVQGIDYSETYAPVARLESLRTVLHLAAALDWEITHLDVKTAFLYGKLDEEIYMKQPKHFEEPGKEDWVWKLKKALYGLKQAGRAWNRRLHEAMTSFGFVRLDAEHGVYCRSATTGASIVVLHVDDICLTTSCNAEKIAVREALGSIFEITDLGEVKWILGISVTRDRIARTITLSQSAYVDKLLTRFEMEDCHPVATPMDHNVILRKHASEADDTSTNFPYRQLIGGVMYLAIATRPDIAFAVHKLSQFSNAPTQVHWTAAKRILRYLKGSKDLGLQLGGTNPIELRGFTDADWAGDVNDRKSTSGYTFSLGAGSISWSAKKQPTTATSSCEAEYVAACHASKELLWLRTLLQSLNHIQRPPTPLAFADDRSTSLACDNQGAISLMKDPSFHARSKHIDIQLHFIRDYVESKQITPHYVPTDDMLADIFTKPLPKPKHEHFRYLLGLRPRSD